MAKRSNAKLTKSDKTADQPISHDTLEDHRRDILGQARKFVRPLGFSRHRFLMITGYILAAVIIVIVGTFALLIYRFQNDSQLVYRAAQIIPYPAAKVDGSYVSYGDYLFELRPLKHYLENVANSSQTGGQTIDFKSEDGQRKLDELKQLAMDKAKRKTAVERLASENDVKVSRAELNETVQTEISNQGGNDKFIEAIEFYYGWNLNDFKRVIKSKLLEEKLRPIYSTEQRQKAEKLLERIKAGEDFTALAKEFSEDPGSKDEGGDLGLSSHGAYVKEFEDAAYNLEPGKVSEVVQTKHGFHIIKMIKKQDDQIQVAHILIRYGDLSQVINDKLSTGGANYIKLPEVPDNTQPVQ